MRISIDRQNESIVLVTKVRFGHPMRTRNLGRLLVDELANADNIKLPIARPS